MAKKKDETASTDEATQPATESLIRIPKALDGRKYAAVQEILKTNLGANQNLGFSDLTKIKIPAGGGTTWEIPRASGEPLETKEIEGVVVAFQDAKSFWKDSLDDTGGGNPPDCRSSDLIQGIGTPGILCAECPNNEFGSATKGKGKACKDLRILYILADDSILPKVIVIPPTSLKPMRQLFLSLAVEEETPYYGAMLSLSLEKDKNDAGIVYSKVVPRVKAVLDEDTLAKASAYNEMLKPMLGAMFSQVIDGNSTHDEEESGEADTIDVEAREEAASTEPEEAY